MKVLHRLQRRFEEFRRIKRRQGTLDAIETSVNFAVRNPSRALSLQGRNYQTETRVDLEERWKLIQRHITTDANNALDIGCSSGEITKRIADQGLLAIGIDRIEPNILANNSRFGDYANLQFLHLELNPRNLSQLPRFDVILLLTVYYHWGREYGWRDAESMLRTTASLSNQLFFETPKSEDQIASDRFREINVESIKDRHQRYLEAVLDNSVVVNHLGTTSYTGGDRKDLLFNIDTSSY